MAEPREVEHWAFAAIAHAHDAQPRDSHLRQPRAGFFRVQADRKGGDFLPAHSPRVIGSLRYCVGCALRYCDGFCRCAWYGLSSKSKAKIN